MLKSQATTRLLQKQDKGDRATSPLTLNFEETEPSVMETVLKFIYTGVVKLPVPWISDVAKLSHK